MSADFYRPESAPRLKSFASYLGGAGVGLLGIAKFMETSLYQQSSLDKAALIGIAGTAWLAFLTGVCLTPAIAARNVDDGVTHDTLGQKVGMRAAYALLGAAATAGFVVATTVGPIALP